MAEQWALITGVSEGGLGDALAREFMSRGIHVIATGPTFRQLDYLSSINGAKLGKLELDVTSKESISAAVKAVERTTNGKLDHLFNNAGYGYMMPLMDADVDLVKKNFDVNLFGVLAVTQAFFPLLKAAKGVVVNQASVAGLTGMSQPFIGSYTSSKTALVDMSNTLRVELEPFGIRVRGLAAHFQVVPNIVFRS
jgi:1-acylglycerone phosphate reductase